MQDIIGGDCGCGLGRWFVELLAWSDIRGVRGRETGRAAHLLCVANKPLGLGSEQSVNQSIVQSELPHSEHVHLIDNEHIFFLASPSGTGHG